MSLDPNTTVTIEDARVIFRNFAGKEGPYNAEGDRNFSVLLDAGLAEEMLRDGWNVKPPKEFEDGDIRDSFINISVKYKGRPPKIVMISSRGRTDVHEDMVELLDSVDTKTVDLVFRPYTWNVGGRGGVKAYLKSMYVTIEEDDLDRKYADVPDVGHHEEHIG